MDTSRVQSLIKYILAEASQDEDWKLRELGPIHIIKYVYLADMYYAMRNDGKTYTGIEWQFYNFGPWSLELYNEIPNAVKIIGANFRTFESKYAKDGVRLSLTGEHLPEDYYEDAVKNIPFGIMSALKRDICNFGPATNDLLHYVYVTPPMTNARPGEGLDFKHVILPKEIPTKTEESSPKLTVRAKKKRKLRILDVRKRIAERREEKKKRMIRPAPPRYDEIFFQGTSELSQEVELAPLENHEGVLQVNPNVWGSDWRKDIDLP